VRRAFPAPCSLPDDRLTTVRRLSEGDPAIVPILAVSREPEL
jgi:hypothetical protein